MAGRQVDGIDQAIDDKLSQSIPHTHPTATHEYSYSPVPDATPRASPDLRTQGNHVFATNESPNPSSQEPIDHEYYFENEDYTYAQTKAAHAEDIVEQFDHLRLHNGKPIGLGIVGGGTIGQTPRTYAEVVKSSRKSIHNQIGCKSNAHQSPIVLRSHSTTSHNNGLRQPAARKAANWSKNKAASPTTGQGSESCRIFKQEHAPINQSVGLAGDCMTPLRRSLVDQIAGTPQHRDRIDPTLSSNLTNSDDLPGAGNFPLQITTSTASTRLVEDFLVDKAGAWIRDSSSEREDCTPIISSWSNAITSPEYLGFDIETVEGIVQCPAGESSSSGSRQGGGQPSRSRGSGQSSLGKRVASLGGRDDINDEFGSDEFGQDEEHPSKSIDRPSKKPNFACHFYKKDPARFCNNNSTGAQYKNCKAGEFKTIGRLKEHLKRRHYEPDHYDPDISKETWDSIGRPERNASCEDKWFSIWQKLFPGEKQPDSPYLDSSGIYAPPITDLRTPGTFVEYLRHHMADQLSPRLNHLLYELNLAEQQQSRVMDGTIRCVNECLIHLLGQWTGGDTNEPNTLHVDGNSSFYLTLPASDNRYQQPNTSPGSYFSPTNTSSSDFSSRRPTTPAQRSCSSKTFDSAYHSSQSSEQLYNTIDPALLATPTPQFQSRFQNQHQAVPPAANLGDSHWNSEVPVPDFAFTSQRPEQNSDSQFDLPDLDQMQYDMNTPYSQYHHQQ